MTMRAPSDQLNDLVRQMLTASGPRFASVAFVKKDGSIRHMNYVNARYRAKHMIGSERGRQASKTFAANNPHMLHVFDASKEEFRTVTLSRVLSFRVDGKTVRVRNYREALKG